MLAPLVGLSLAAALAGTVDSSSRDSEPSYRDPALVAVAAAADVLHVHHATGDTFVEAMHRPAPDGRPKSGKKGRTKVRISFGAGQDPTYLQIGQRAEVIVRATPKGPTRPVVLQHRAPIRGWDDVARTRLRAGVASFVIPTEAAALTRYRVLLPQHQQRSKAKALFRIYVNAPVVPVPPLPGPPPPPEPRGDPSQYTFMVKNRAGVPARWDACVPITWGYNPAGASAANLADVREGIERLAAQTGYTFVFTGESDQIALSQNGPARSEPRLLVSFGDELTRPDVFQPGSNLAGRAGPRGIRPSNHPGDPAEITQGDVLLRTNGYGASVPGYEVGSWFGRLVLHELGHAVNLDHVDEAVQVMATTSPAWTAADHRGYNLGDIAGLRAVGSGAGCFTKPQR